MSTDQLKINFTLDDGYSFYCFGKATDLTSAPPLELYPGPTLLGENRWVIKLELESLPNLSLVTDSSINFWYEYKGCLMVSSNGKLLRLEGVPGSAETTILLEADLDVIVKKNKQQLELINKLVKEIAELRPEVRSNLIAALMAEGLL